MTDLTTSAIRWKRDANGVVLLTLDDPQQSANTMGPAFRWALAETLARIEAEQEEITGIIVTSAKKTFLAGGDLNELKEIDRGGAGAISERVRLIKAQLRKIETCGKPVVAAINGAALGGGLELALATHHRIMVDKPGAVVGFPEVQLGLLPGGGGVLRSVRLLGVIPALTNLLLSGDPLTPARALELGIVDQVVPSIEDLVPAARRWIAENPTAVQPWDVNGYVLPGGRPSDAALAAKISMMPAALRVKLKGANYPAPHHILAAAVEGALVDFANASEIEGRYFVDLVTGQIAKNMIQAFFFDMQEVRGSRGRPAETERTLARKAVVVGAGMMGAGIAYACAKAGIDVVLKDVSLEAAQRGKAYSERLVSKAVSAGKASREDSHELLARIHPTADSADAYGADLVIEAVFEDPAVKAAALADIEPYVNTDALLSSNTSTLPISDLAQEVSRPEDFIGLHFFSPVDKMPLLEIVMGQKTSPRALYRALDVAKQIGKTPIVVNDSRGFFTSRVISAFVNEAIGMLIEGVPPASIEQASLQAGYPASVLQLSDELNLNLLVKIRQQYRRAAQAAGQQWQELAADTVLARVLDHGRGGRVAGAGFYDYVDGKRANLWKGLAEVFPPVSDPAALSLEDLKERMLFLEAIEAVKCFDEGVITSTADANVGSILGIGFPGWTGGVIQYVHGYPGGTAGFVARARELADRYGERFTPPPSLLDKVSSRMSA